MYPMGGASAWTAVEIAGEDGTGSHGVRPSSPREKSLSGDSKGTDQSYNIMEKAHRGTPSCDITWISLVRSHQLPVGVGGGLRRPRRGTPTLWLHMMSQYVTFSI